MFLTSSVLYAQYTSGTNNSTSGAYNTFVGNYAGQSNASSGYYNSFFGADAGRDNTTADGGVFVGFRSGYNNTAGSNNTFIGNQSAFYNTSGHNNAFLGYRSGFSNTTGDYNTFLGDQSGNKNTTGRNNTFTGHQSGFANKTGSNNAFVGYQAGRNVISGSNNAFVGYRSGYYNNTGTYNTFTGHESGYYNNSGSYNAFVGYRAGYSNKTADANSFFGVSSGRYNTTGGDNTFIGFQTGFLNQTGKGNTLVGNRAGLKVTGDYNVMIGNKAGENETGSNQLYIDNSNTAEPLIHGDFEADALTFNGKVGINSDVPSPSFTTPEIQLYVDGRFSQLVRGNLGGFGPNDRWSSLGNSFIPGIDEDDAEIYGMFNQGFGSAFISGSKLGGDNIIGFTGNNLDFDILEADGSTDTVMSLDSDGNLTTDGTSTATSMLLTSDKRYKENIKVIENAMDKIQALDGFTYDFKDKEINGRNLKAITGKKQIGFVAQNVQEVFPELIEADKNSYLSVNYVAIIPVLVEAMKEQQEVIDEQEEEMIQKTEQITDLRTRLEKLEALFNNTEDIQGSITPAAENTDMSGVVLRQNMPNPLRDRTTIEYQLPDNLKTASLTVFDLNGKSITTYNIAGKGFVEFDASGLPNGTYAYAIVANGRSIASQKMVIQR